MGSEHSSLQSGPPRRSSLNQPDAKQVNLRRQYTIANSKDAVQSPEPRPGSISPGPSVCGDIDLPYISYTVNQPIGDSPKITSKQLVKPKRKIPPKTPKKQHSHNIVVVKAPVTAPNLEKDPDILRLQSIPMFLPIMRATLSLPAARDPEVLERLDPVPLHKLCVKYQAHLTSCSNLVATEQNQITQKVREVDSEVGRLVSGAIEKQKRFAKYAEKLSKVQELSHQLNRCHMMLNQILESMETLNNLLDIDDRLEPFVWTTG